jgi:hypothetical protein
LNGRARAIRAPRKDHWPRFVGFVDACDMVFFRPASISACGSGLIVRFLTLPQQRPE